MIYFLKNQLEFSMQFQQQTILKMSKKHSNCLIRISLNGQQQECQ